MSANSRRIFLVGIATVAFSLAVAILLFGSMRGSVSSAAQAAPGMHTLRLDGQEIFVSIADTETLREKGLGGRAGLSPNEGMLFIFATQGKYAFWMKDMRFAIDILWLANDGTVLYIKESVLPDTYPTSFAPPSPARYVLELPAGYAKAHGVKVGDKAQI